MIVALLVACTLLLHASLEAFPLWSKAIERARLAERQYRLSRINEAIRRFSIRNSSYPSNLDELCHSSNSGPYLPRVYLDPCRNDGCWQLLKNITGGITVVKHRTPDSTLIRPPKKMPKN